MKQFIKKVIGYFINSINHENKYSSTGYSYGIKNVNFHGKNSISKNCNFSGNIELGYSSTLGSHVFLHGNISVGKYCQMGSYVAVHTTNHPTEYLSTYINKNLFNGELKQLKTIRRTEIGNDVWIGHNVTIVGGVKIGNGAIIAAGSIVTKDVDAYTIVAGNPSVTIRKRFSDEIINEIENLKWWNLSENELQKIKPLFFKNLKHNQSLF